MNGLRVCKFKQITVEGYQVNGVNIMYILEEMQY